MLSCRKGPKSENLRRTPLTIFYTSYIIWDIIWEGPKEGLPKARYCRLAKSELGVFDAGKFQKASMDIFKTMKLVPGTYMKELNLWLLKQVNENVLDSLVG